MAMKWNRVTDDALHMLIYLAQQQGVVSSIEIASFLGVKPSVVVQRGALLKNAGLIDVTKGMSGGYFLAKNPKVISLYEAIIAAESPKLFPVDSSMDSSQENHFALFYLAFQLCADTVVKNVSVYDAAIGNMNSIEKAKKRAYNEVIAYLSGL